MFSSLFDSIPDALVVVDRDGRIVAANARAETLFGYPPDGLDGLPVEALVPDDARERHRHHAAGYMARPRIRPMGDTEQSLTGQRLDGSRFPVEIALSPFDSESGTRFLASIRDVSESRRVQQSLLRARYDALLARVGQLAVESSDSESVIQAIPSLLAEQLQVQSVVLAMTRAGGGIEVRAASGLPDEWERIASDLAEPHSQAWQALSRGNPLAIGEAGPALAGSLLMAGGSAERGGVVVPLLDREQPMGALVAMAATPHRFDHDTLHVLQSVAHLLATLLQRRRSEEQLVHAQQLEAIGQLTGGIAHDFNNLLTIVTGNLELLGYDLENETSRAYLKRASDAADMGAALTKRLLTFARRRRLTTQVIDVNDLVLGLTEILKRSLGEPITLTTVLAGKLWHTRTDPSELENAILNLAINARDAMPAGGDLIIETKNAPAADIPANMRPGEYVLITVSDTGQGMPPEVMERAFEPFFTTKEPGRGTGLGLSTIYGFAEQSGGYCTISSTLGKGTSVSLYLPRAAADADTVRPDAAEPIPLSENCEVVLVVEDNPEVRELTLQRVEGLGYVVHEAENGPDAVRLIDSGEPVDVILSDIVMAGGMSGYDLARWAKDNAPHIKVILTTGYAAEEASNDPAELIDAPILRKPYPRADLAKALRNALRAPSG